MLVRLVILNLTLNKITLKTLRRSLDENETRQYIRQIVSAVDHMHRAKVIHRDIKLQNFMLDQNFNLIIIGNSLFIN